MDLFFRVCQGLFVASILTTLLVVAAALLDHQGYQREVKFLVPQRSSLRMLSLALVSLSILTDAVTIAVRHSSLTPLRHPTIQIILLCLIWFSLRLRKRPFCVGVTALSLIVLIFPFTLSMLFPSHYGCSHQELGSTARLVVQYSCFMLHHSLILGIEGKQGATKIARQISNNNENDDKNAILDPVSEQGPYNINSPVGSTDDDNKKSISDPPHESASKPQDNESLFQKLLIFLPILLPLKNIKYQASFAVYVACLVGEGWLKVNVPHQLSVVVDKLIANQAALPDFITLFILNVMNSKIGPAFFQSLADVTMKQLSHRKITTTTFDHVMNMSAKSYFAYDPADIVKHIHDGRSLEELPHLIFLQILPNMINTFFACLTLYRRFGCFLAAGMFLGMIVFISLHALCETWTIKLHKRLTKANQRQSHIIREAVQCRESVSAFNMFEYERDHLRDAIDQTFSTQWTNTFCNLCIALPVELILLLTHFFLGRWVIRAIYEGVCSPGDHFFFIQYLGDIEWPMKLTLFNIRCCTSDIVEVEQLMSLLATESTVKDNEGAITLARISGHITVDQISFSYDGKMPILKNVSFNAMPGQVIGVVGATGAGKSTLAKLLMRTYDPSGGSISVDGYDIRDVKRRSLRAGIGVVPQNPKLFSRSIKENLLYARRNASIEEMHDACRSASIHEDIMRFPKGYDTVVGHNGHNLSGG